MRIRHALAALAVAAFFAQSSPASAQVNNAHAHVNYGHAPTLLKVAVIGTMIMSASVVFNAICVSRKQNRQLTQQEAYLAAALPFAWIVLNQPSQRLLRRR